MIKALREFSKKNIFLRKLIGYHAASSGIFDFFFKSYKLSGLLLQRSTLVSQSPDNAFIPRVSEAGRIGHGKQIMHNGLKIYLGSYYGPEYAQLLLLNQGVHEPQEERVFMEVINSLPANSLMIEMGAFWSFYSMWFQKVVPGAVNYMIEPDSFNLGHGKRNFSLNNMKGHFVQAFVSSKSTSDGDTPTISVDDFVRKNNIDFIHMLHSDIQGFEYEMLLGASECFMRKKIGYVFISTHSNEIHEKCLVFLEEQQFFIIASANLSQSFSEDGFIGARAPYYPGIGQVGISKRNEQL